MPLVKVAGIQMSCSSDIDKNLEKCINLIELAAERGANVICLQELFNTLWFPKDSNPENFALAEKVDGKTIRLLKGVAKKTGTVIIAPFFEKGIDGIYYNSAVVIDEKGQLVGTYRKVHVPQLPMYEESFYFSAGDLGFPVFDTSYGKIGIQICWDNFYPEGIRSLALKGAQIVFAPTAAAFASHEKWKTVLSASAITNGLYVFRVNRVGNEDRHNFYGEAFCVNPLGEMVERPSGMGDGIYEVDIDLSMVEKTRQDYPYLKNRRPELYGPIAGQKTVVEKKIKKIVRKKKD